MVASRCHQTEVRTEVKPCWGISRKRCYFVVEPFSWSHGFEVHFIVLCASNPRHQRLHNAFQQNHICTPHHCNILFHVLSLHFQLRRIAVLEDQECRHSRDTIFFRDVFDMINVDLDKCELALNSMLISQLGENGRNSAARWAPVCVKVDDSVFG
jgi:hypothetical protein